MRSMLGQSNRQLDGQFNELFLHYTDVPAELWRWPNFTPEEIACPLTGQVYVESISLDCIQRTREDLGRPINLNSAHRSRLHNVRVKGAPRSRHLLLAFDIKLDRHNRRELYVALRRAGFGSFGFYNTFIHADIRPGRRWWSSHSAKRTWEAALR